MYKRQAWKYVIERHADWTLEIWGEGELRTELEEQIRNNQLTNNIFLKGYTYDIFSPLYEEMCIRDRYRGIYPPKPSRGDQCTLYIINRER